MLIRIERFCCLFIACLALSAVASAWMPSEANGQVRRGKAVPAHRLPESLRTLEIKDFYVPGDLKAVGRIQRMSGTVVVVHEPSKKAYFGAAGDLIHEKDTIITLPDSRCRISFSGDDVVAMAPDTRFSVELYREQEMEGKRSFFSMLKGKAMFYALRLFRYRDTRFRVKTPTAIVGVRGTKFGIHVYWVEERRADGAGIRIADRRDNADLYLAQAGSEEGGIKSYTDCFSEDGILDVNGRIVHPGEMFKGDTGLVVPTPPEYIRAFEAETEVAPEGEGVSGGEGEGKKEGEAEAGKGGQQEGEGEGKDESSEGGVAAMDSGGATTPEDFSEFAGKQAETTQQEVATETEAEQDISNGKIIREVGGIALLLANAAGQLWTGTDKGPLYHSSEPNYFRSSGGADSFTAYEDRHENNSAYKLVADETDASGSRIHVNTFDWGTGGNLALTSPHDFDYHLGGRYYDAEGNEYLEWGWWEDSSATDKGLLGEGSGLQYFAAGAKIWHIEGKQTHPDYIDYLQGQGASYKYTGEVKGVFGDSSASFSPPTVVTGTFSCDVNFQSRAVSNFELDASGGTAPVVNVNLSDGSGTIESDGTFDLENFSGTIGPGSGHSVSPTQTGGGGTFFGKKAEGIGGMWHAHDGSDYWAVGEFHGKR
ncbi:MAG: FecR domain-containing protein [Deltaproteobacteria bacterium]|nr:FecR domain-containing protein [Deltaproteobacteria bacterium]